MRFFFTAANKSNTKPAQSGLFYYLKKEMASRKLTDLSLEMQPLAAEFEAWCKADGLDVVIICTHRPDSEQQSAYDAKLSNCKPGESAHNQMDSQKRPAAEAFDVGVIRNGKYIGRGDDPDYLAAGKIGEALGLLWAGRWTGKLKETAHFQNKSWKKPS